MSSPGSPTVYDLSTPEEIAARKRRRRWILGGVALVAILALGWWAGRPGLRAVKAWQARRHAAEAMRLLEAGNAQAAATQLQDALVLRGNDLEVMRQAANFLTRVGHGNEAVSFWKEIERQSPLNAGEQRAYATDLLLVGNLPEAERRRKLAWPDGTEGTPADWELALRAAAQSRDATAAVPLARRLLESKSAEVTDRQRLEAAVTLLGVNDPTQQATAVKAMHTLAEGKPTPESLDALLALAKAVSQQVAAERQNPGRAVDAGAQELAELADRIEKHPLSKAPQVLTALQLRNVAHPDQRAALVQAAIDRYGHTESNDDLAALGTSLYAQGEFQRLLEVLPPERATTNRVLYLQYLDALGALDRWEDIRRTVEGQKFSLDPMIEQMYLARCAKQLHQPETAAVHWTTALREAGADPEKLLNLGRYAQGDGQLPTAEAAFRAAIKAAPSFRPAHEALLGVLGTEGRTRDARDTVRAMRSLWPDDAAVRNDDAYLSALLKEDLDQARDTARELMVKEPGSLPHRVTLALAELRLGHDLTALEVVQAVDSRLFGIQPRYQAVYAAVLWATDHPGEAREVAKSTAADRLLPEERELLSPIQEAAQKQPAKEQ